MNARSAVQIGQNNFNNISHCTELRIFAYFSIEKNQTVIEVNYILKLVETTTKIFIIIFRVFENVHIKVPFALVVQSRTVQFLISIYFVVWIYTHHGKW